MKNIVLIFNIILFKLFIQSCSTMNNECKDLLYKYKENNEDAEWMKDYSEEFLKGCGNAKNEEGHKLYYFGDGEYKDCVKNILKANNIRLEYVYPSSEGKIAYYIGYNLASEKIISMEIDLNFPINCDK